MLAARLCEAGRWAVEDVVWVLRRWLRGLDLNQRPSGYEPDELPDCSTPRHLFVAPQAPPPETKKPPRGLHRQRLLKS